MVVIQAVNIYGVPFQVLRLSLCWIEKRNRCHSFSIAVSKEPQKALLLKNCYKVEI